MERLRRHLLEVGVVAEEEGEEVHLPLAVVEVVAGEEVRHLPQAVVVVAVEEVEEEQRMPHPPLYQVPVRVRLGFGNEVVGVVC